jgi:hypothetical protein
MILSKGLDQLREELYIGLTVLLTVIIDSENARYGGKSNLSISI